MRKRKLPSKVIEIYLSCRGLSYTDRKYQDGKLKGSIVKIREMIQDAVKQQGLHPKQRERKVRLDLTFHLNGPKKRIDLDNLCKFILDELDKADLYNDDSQVVELHAEKIWPSHTNLVLIKVKYFK